MTRGTGRTGRPRTLHIVLTPEERTQLERWARAHRLSQQLVRRSRLMLLVAAGTPITQVAQAVGLSRHGVYLCLHRFQAQGMDGLVPSPRRGGRPRKVLAAADGGR